MKHSLVYALLAVTLSSCGQQAHHHSSDTEVGRFVFYPPTENAPGILLDTKTGCLEQLIKLTAIDNPKQVSWARAYMDGTIPEVDYSDPQPKEIAGSAPPQRCPNQLKAAKK